MSGKLDAIRAILAGVHHGADLCFHMQGANGEMVPDIILFVVGNVKKDRLNLFCFQHAVSWAES